jgi:high affinity sulfate transporter 1
VEPRSTVPIISTLRRYQRSDLRPDFVAGVVLATMLVPQGIAYAELTGLPAITGIYTTIAALLAYSVFGPNRRLILGPDSSLAPVIAAVVLPLAAGDGSTATVLASALGLLAGVVCIASGFFRFGVVTELLSRPIRIGYLNGIAVIIFVSQVPKALGFEVGAESTIGTVSEILQGLVDSAVIPAALGLSVTGVVLILGLNRVSRFRPGVVVAAVVSILAVSVFGLAVEVVGDIPTGFPAPVWPAVGLDALPTLLAGAIAVALVSFADTGALSTATALKSGERVDPNDEIKALGAANILSGLFQGFATSASSSRTAVALAVGSRTQLTGLVAAGAVVCIVVAVPQLVTMMPEPALAAIVMTASFALFDLKSWTWLGRVRRSELYLSLATAVAVVTLGVLEGIGVAIALSLGVFIARAWRPHSTELAHVEGIAGYHDRQRHPEATPVEGLLIMRYDAPLFFANAADFGRSLQDLLRAADRPVRRVLVVGNAVTDIDSTGAEILSHVLDDLDQKGVAFGFAGLKGRVKDRLRAYGLYDRIGDGSFFPNTISAAEAHRREEG